MTRRVSFRWNWWPINRPYVFLCDPDEGRIIVCLCWGNKNSDPVWSLDVELGGIAARPFIALADRQWDRAVAAQEARK